MSGSNVDQQQYSCDDCDGGCCSADIMAYRQPCRRTAVQSFDLDAEFRRRFKLYDDDEEEEEQDGECVISPEHSEYSDDYTSMTGSGASTSTLPPGLLNDRLASLSVSSGGSFSLYNLDDDDDDRCSISTLENVDDVEDQNVTDTGTTSPPVLPPARSSAVAEEDLELNFLARPTPTTVCRSASLKSTYGSTPPCSPRTKKVVRFADALGLDLESIRHILDVNDALPTSLGRSPSDFGHPDGPVTSAKVGVRTKLMARFSEPGSSVNFLRRVQERKISLEEVSVDAERLTVTGVIRVANVAYHKQVCSLLMFRLYCVGYKIDESFIHPFNKNYANTCTGLTCT